MPTNELNREREKIRDSDVIRYTLYLIVFALICNKTLWLAAGAAAAATY